MKMILKATEPTLGFVAKRLSTVIRSSAQQLSLLIASRQNMEKQRAGRCDLCDVLVVWYLLFTTMIMLFLLRLLSEGISNWFAVKGVGFHPSSSFTIKKCFLKVLRERGQRSLKVLVACFSRSTLWVTCCSTRSPSIGQWAPPLWLLDWSFNHDPAVRCRNCKTKGTKQKRITKNE